MGTLTWTPDRTAPDGKPMGSMQITDDGKTTTLTFGTEYEWVTEGLARQHAVVRGLDFVIVDG